MKKCLAFLLCLLTVLSFTACAEVKEGLEQGIQDAVQSVADEANKAVSRGQIDGNVYTSTYSSLTFTKPDSWTYSTDEEIAATMNISADLLDQNAYEQTMTTMMSVYDMMVVDPVSSSNIIVSYENLKLSNSESITEEEYFEAVQEQLAAQMVVDASPVECTTVTLSGQPYHRMEMSSSYNGVTLCQYYYARKIDSFMSLVIVTLNDYSDLTIADIEAMFS